MLTSFVFHSKKQQQKRQTDKQTNKVNNNKLKEKKKEKKEKNSRYAVFRYVVTRCAVTRFTNNFSVVCCFTLVQKLPRAFCFPMKLTKYFFSPLYNHTKSVNFVNEIFYLINLIVSIFLSETDVIVVILLCWTRFSFFELQLYSSLSL